MSVYFIAEVSSNHHQSIDRCFEFIDTAAAIGCDSVKFQLFRIEQLFSEEILRKNKEIRDRKNWELPIEYIPLLAERCKLKKISFGCTPFDLEAVKILEPYVDFYKIASYELLWDELIKSCCLTKKPVILSTGMAEIDEIKHAIKIVKDNDCVDFSILHCISGYPTPLNQCNLKAIETLRTLDKSFKVGWSDHSVNDGVLYRAINRWGASIIEFHLDLDGKGEEFKTGHCWLPNNIKKLITSIKSSSIMDGNGSKKPSEIEITERDWRADPKDGLRPLKHIRKDY